MTVEAVVPVDTGVQIELVPVAVTPRFESSGPHAAAEEVEAGRVGRIALYRVGRNRRRVLHNPVVVVLVIDRTVNTQALEQVIHRMLEFDRVVQQRVENAVRTGPQQTDDGILVADRTGGLIGQRVLLGSGDTSETFDQMAVNHTGRDERIGIVDILHDALVSRRKIVGVAAAAQTLRFAELAGHIDRHLKILGHLNVEIRTEVVAIEVRPRIGIVIPDVRRDALL